MYIPGIPSSERYLGRFSLNLSISMRRVECRKFKNKNINGNFTKNLKIIMNKIIVLNDIGNSIENLIE